MWKTVSCAVRGAGHIRSETPCQDKTIEFEQDGVYVIALADGAGSARLSHYGAERVVRVATEYAAEHFKEWLACEDGRQVKQSFLEALLNSLAEEAQVRGCNVNELASTLLLAAVDAGHYVLLHIGDGVIGYLDAGELKVASMPDNGEFSNVTTFVTSDEALISMRLFKGELKEKNAFVLMSDGTEQSLYHKSSKTLADVVVKLMQRTCLINNELMKKQLEDAFTTVISKNTQDDCSVAIIVRPSLTLGSVETLPLEQRLELYGISNQDRRYRRRTNCFDSILLVAQSPRSLRQIAREIHLKPRYAQKRINRLISLGLLVKKGNMYQRP